MLRSIATDDVLEVQHWCREYEQTNAYPVGGAHIRYAIAIYQLYQAMTCSDARVGDVTLPTNRSEALAAAALNFVMVAETWNAPLEAYIDRNVLKQERKPISWEQLLLDIAAAQQHVFYGYVINQNSSARARRRFDLQSLAQHLTHIITALVLEIPQQQRVAALEAAMDILVGRI